MVAEHVGEAPAAEAEAVFAAGLVEETVGAQVEGPARRQRYLDVAVVATALVADRPARALEFLDLLAVAGVQRDLRPGEGQLAAPAVDPDQPGIHVGGQRLGICSWLSMLRIAWSVSPRIAAGSRLPTASMAWSMAARASMVISAPGTP